MKIILGFLFSAALTAPCSAISPASQTAPPTQPAEQSKQLGLPGPILPKTELATKIKFYPSHIDMYNQIYANKDILKIVCGAAESCPSPTGPYEPNGIFWNAALTRLEIIRDKASNRQLSQENAKKFMSKWNIAAVKECQAGVRTSCNKLFENSDISPVVALKQKESINKNLTQAKPKREKKAGEPGAEDNVPAIGAAALPSDPNAPPAGGYPKAVEDPKAGAAAKPDYSTAFKGVQAFVYSSVIGFGLCTGPLAYLGNPFMGAILFGLLGAAAVMTIEKLKG